MRSGKIKYKTHIRRGRPNRLAQYIRIPDDLSSDKLTEQAFDLMVMLHVSAYARSMKIVGRVEITSGWNKDDFVTRYLTLLAKANAYRIPRFLKRKLIRWKQTSIG